MTLKYTERRADLLCYSVCIEVLLMVRELYILRVLGILQYIPESPLEVWTPDNISIDG